MIFTRAPVRFSLGGGGTDLPAYSREHGGFLVAAAIDKYVRVAVARHAEPDIVYRTGQDTERAGNVALVRHPLLRECLRVAGVTGGVSVRTQSDVPAGSGLGSSGAFTVALLDALFSLQGRVLTRGELAELACHVEMSRLGEPVGKQDQFIAAFGGVRAFTFHRNDAVSVERVPMSENLLEDFVSRIVVLWSGVTRRASDVLDAQQKSIADVATPALASMHRIKELGFETLRILTRGTFDAYGELLHEHWTAKRRLASKVSDPVLDEHYEAARRAGAVGGKVMGAGGGGFFMFYVRPEQRRSFVGAMHARGLHELPFTIDHAGARTRIRPEADAVPPSLRESA